MKGGPTLFRSHFWKFLSSVKKDVTSVLGHQKSDVLSALGSSFEIAVTRDKKLMVLGQLCHFQPPPNRFWHSYVFSTSPSQFWHRDVILNFPKPVLAQLCRFPKAFIEFAGWSWTEMSFPIQFWGSDVILTS